MRNKSALYLIPFAVFFIGLTVCLSAVPFFWDSIMLTSRPAFWYFDNTFLKPFLPAHIDNGHPPLLGFYLAIIWHIFGKSLLVCHVAMLPFVLGCLWNLHKIIQYFYTGPLIWMIMALAVFDATFLAQSIYMGPDLVLCLFFLMATNALLNKKPTLFLFALLPIGVLSIRGLFLLLSLFIIYFIKNENLSIFKRILPFVPAGILAAMYFLFHYFETGWLLNTPNEGWAAHRGFNSFSGMLKNVVVFNWRLIDFGRIGIWVCLIVLFFKKSEYDESIQKKLGTLWLICIAFFLVHAVLFIPLRNPIAHRYFLPIFPIFAILVAILILEWKAISQKTKSYILGSLILLQLLGNLIVYPTKTAQGWDASLAALPYFELRKEMVNYINEEEIDYVDVGTAFPNFGAMQFIELNEEYTGFHQKDFDKEEYIFYSNVYNDFSDEQIDELQNEWKLVKKIEKMQIWVALYKRN